jgi:hypothetical protein
MSATYNVGPELTTPNNQPPLSLAEFEARIKEDLAAAKEATDTALERNHAAGQKLIEAQAAHPMKLPEFKGWLKGNLGISYSHARRLMKLAEFLTREKSKASGWRGWRDFQKKTKKPRAAKEEQEPDVKMDARTRSKLADSIIAAGYKKLATELHPDKGGSTEDMQRLNAARDDLKAKRRPFVVETPQTDSPGWDANPQEFALQMLERMPPEKIWKIFGAVSDALKARQNRKAA